MPHSTNPTLPFDEGRNDYIWRDSQDENGSMTRKLANLEKLFAIFNKNMYGQNCPLMGASMSIQHSGKGSESGAPLNMSRLYFRALTAFAQTRWKYPTVAATMPDLETVSYRIESSKGVEKWTNRTVFLICRDGGWQALRERLSRTSAIPSESGDCCVFYLIVSPEQTLKTEIEEFDILMHTHHTLVDGSGIRVILNEFLERLANPMESETIVWGEETARLFPAAVALERPASSPSNDAAQTTQAVPEERLKAFSKPDIGLPVYRPEIKGLRPEHRGTLLVSHTFEASGYLPSLLKIGRSHGVKLTGILHAAMLKAVYEMSETKPDAEEVYQGGSPMDLRNGHLVEEFCDRTRYVNSAVAIQQIKIPCKFFAHTQEETNENLWKAAACVGEQWEQTRHLTGLATRGESDAKNLIESLERMKKAPPTAPSKPRTCPTFSSDPPGSQGLKGTYQFTGDHSDSTLVLKSYQLATDQIQAVVSARSHSWNGLLTLCLVFNALRNPKEKMQAFLDKWVEVLNQINLPDAVEKVDV